MDAVAELNTANTSEEKMETTSVTDQAFVIVNDAEKGETESAGEEKKETTVEEPAGEEKKTEESTTNEKGEADEEDTNKEAEENENENEKEEDENENEENEDADEEEEDENEECECECHEENVIEVHHRYEYFPPIMTNMMYVLLVLNLIRVLIELFGEPLNCPCFPMRR